MGELVGGHAAYFAAGGLARFTSAAFLPGAEVGEVEFLDGYHRHALALGVFDELADRFPQGTEAMC